MVSSTHLSSVYAEHASEMHKRYRRIVSRRAVVNVGEDRTRKAVLTCPSSSHITAVKVRLAAANSLDILV